MTFKEWYAFNKQIRAFNLGNTYVKIMRKNSLNAADEVGTVKMSLKDIELFFGDYVIVYVNEHKGMHGDHGVDLGMCNPNLVNLK